MGIIIMIRKKLSLIYRENSFIFNLPFRVVLLMIRGEIIGRNNVSAAIPTLEEGLLHKNNLVLNCLT
jgi:hypothetical protein